MRQDRWEDITLVSSQSWCFLGTFRDYDSLLRNIQFLVLYVSSHVTLKDYNNANYVPILCYLKTHMTMEFT